MARIRKSKTDTRLFMDIPKEHEMDDKDKIKRKYKKILKGKDGKGRD